jgi:diguanylate cyclase (GGDEF)-like protein
MSIDSPTLILVATCMTVLLGVFLLLLWIQERAIRALAWWAAAYMIGGSAVGLWSAQDTISWLVPEAPNTLLFIACGLIWNGARLFHGRPVLPGALFAGAAIWIAACLSPAFASLDGSRVVLSSIIIACYTFLAAYELRADRRKANPTSIKQFLVPALHGVVFLSPTLVVVLFPQAADENVWFALFALETLLYVVATAFIVAIMAKDQVVLVHKTAAMIDPLTELYNRRAFFEAAKRLNAQQARRHGSVSVLLFDLDHFKSINDRYGHAMGDDALKAFAVTATGRMRVTDIIGRLGGEEFAAIVPGNAAEAAIVAERVRASFQTAGLVISHQVMNATVSVGVAGARAPAVIEEVMERADAALYRAKGGGRNRVTIAAIDGTVDFPTEHLTQAAIALR